MRLSAAKEQKIRNDYHKLLSSNSHFTKELIIEATNTAIQAIKDATPPECKAKNRAV